MQYFTVEKIGPKREVTPEGYLLCLEVPIGRTGSMVYSPADGLPVPAKNGVINISRDADEVFRPETMASFNGKPITFRHPPDLVDPDNYREYVVGVVLNPRQGAAPNDDLMIGDLLITVADAIQAVLDKEIEEVSSGYDAQYEVLEPGRGRQHTIVGNHVALVERGRCGPRCAIGDEDTSMSKKAHFLNRIRNAILAKDAEGALSEIESAKKESGMEVGHEGFEVGDDGEMTNLSGAGGGGEHLHVHVHAAGAREDDSEDPPVGGAGGAQPMGAAEGKVPGAAGEGGGDESEIIARLDRLEAEHAEIMEVLEDIEGDEDAEMEGGEASGAEGGAEGAAEGEEKPEKETPEQAQDRKAKARDARRKMPFKDRAMRVRDAASKRRARTRDAMKKILGKLEFYDPETEATGVEGSGKPEGKTATGDSASLQSEWNNVAALAEILVPGFKSPTFDAKAPAKVTHERMCSFKRRVLIEAMSQPHKDDVIKATGGTSDFTKITCDAVSLAFSVASEHVKGLNRSKTQGVANAAGMILGAGQSVATKIGEINKRNRERFK